MTAEVVGVVSAGEAAVDVVSAAGSLAEVVAAGDVVAVSAGCSGGSGVVPPPHEARIKPSATIRRPMSAPRWLTAMLQGIAGAGVHVSARRPAPDPREIATDHDTPIPTPVSIDIERDMVLVWGCRGRQGGRKCLGEGVRLSLGVSILDEKQGCRLVALWVARGCGVSDANRHRHRQECPAGIRAR